jgi:hypothetical protein
LRSVTLELESHPQETTENSVDQGLLIAVHGYEAVSVLEPLKVDGPYLTAKYTMTRVNPWLSVFPAIVNAFQVHVWGLGYSMVEIHTETFDFHFRLFILPMPLDGDRIQLRIALTVRRDCTAASVSPMLGVLPRAMSLPILQRATLQGIAGDIRQDFDIWQHKKYVQPQILARGDGPTGPYRSYCRQHYPELRVRSNQAAE